MKNNAKTYCFYGFNDNEPGPNESSGWVDKLCHYIERIAEKQHQESIHVEAIDITKGLDSYDFLSAESTVICIVSNEALTDVSWHNFMDEMPTHVRIISLIKEPIHRADFPSGVANSFKLDFYLTDPTSANFITSHELFAPRNLNLFLVKVFDLTRQLLQPISTEKTDKKNIFLALCSYDVANVRDELRRELSQLGYTVLPQIAYPGDIENIREVIFQDLKQCDFSVQLFGQHYDYGTYDTELSIEEIQHELIVEYYQMLAEDEEGEVPFNRIIWVAENQSQKDEKQVNFLNRLNSDPKSLRKAEFVRSTIEELKDIIVSKLERNNKKTVGFDRSPDIDSEKSVYLMSRVNYAEVHKEIKSILEKNEAQLLTTDIELDNEASGDIHRNHLMSCSGVLLIAEQSDLLWLRSKMNDVRKAYSWGRNKEYDMVAVLSEGIEKLPADSIFNEVKLIRKQGDLTDQLLAPFINEFE